MANNTHSIDYELSSTQFSSRADTASLSVTGDLTVEAYVKLEQLPSTAGTRFTIMSKFGDTGGDADKRSYRIAITSSDKFEIIWSADGTGDNNDIWDSDASVGAIGIWQHLAVTLDVSAQQPLFYFNGAVTAGTRTAQNGTATSIDDNDVDFAIGDTPKTSTRTYFDGKINNARLWSDIRTAGEILANRDKVIELAAGLEGSWYAQNNHLDLTGNSNDLTASGGPVFSSDVPFSTGRGDYSYIM